MGERSTVKRSIIMGLCVGAVVYLSMGLPADAYDTVLVADGGCYGAG